MLDLPQKLEAAAKALIDKQGADATCYVGLGHEEKELPCIVVAAVNGNETPQGSGNYMLSLMVEIRSAPKDNNIDEHRALCRAALGCFSQEDSNDQLSGAAADFHVFGITNRQSRESVEERTWVTEMTMECYCAGLALT